MKNQKCTGELKYVKKYLNAQNQIVLIILNKFKI